MSRTNHWDYIRSCPTVLYGNYPNGAHESLLRSHTILREVRCMLDRGDSAESIATFIDWAESKPPKERDAA